MWGQNLPETFQPAIGWAEPRSCLLGCWGDPGPGRWCQVPGAARPSLCSPLRAFVGSSDKLVRGAGRRPPPNRLSQKGEENERLGVEGSGPPVPTALWERGGGAGLDLPALKGSIPHDLSEGSLSPGPLRNQTPGLKEHRGQCLRKAGFGGKFREPPPRPCCLLISPTTCCPHTCYMPGTQAPGLLQGFLLFTSSEPPRKQAGQVNDSHSTEEDTEDQSESLVNSKLRAACPDSIIESSFLHCISLRSHPQSHSV